MFTHVSKPVLSLLKIKTIDIYNNVFKLHTKLTVAFLLIFSIFVTAHEYFGTPIDCVTGIEKYKKYADHLCWINGTYTIIIHGSEPKMKNMVSHGVQNKFNVTTEEIIYQRYYQWIIVILFIQALMFYLPAFLWKIWEHKRINELCKNLDSPMLPDDYNDSKQRVLKYLLGNNKDAHTIYAIRFFICEGFNLLVVIANIFFLDFMFSGFWYEYAPAIGALFSKSWSEWSEHSARLFPKLTKCDFQKYGPSGSIETFDALCLLSLNILNEKIFAFEWIWICILFIVSCLNLIYRLFVLVCRGFRIRLLRSLAMPLTHEQIKLASNKGQIGEFFILYQLGKNINPYVFREIVHELADLKKFDKNKKCDLYA